MLDDMWWRVCWRNRFAHRRIAFRVHPYDAAMLPKCTPSFQPTILEIAVAPEESPCEEKIFR